jgi:hypothetical protein
MEKEEIYQGIEDELRKIRGIIVWIGVFTLVSLFFIFGAILSTNAHADDLFDLSDIALSTGLPAPKYKVTVEIVYNSVPYDRAKQIMEDMKKHADGCKFSFKVEKVGDDTLTGIDSGTSYWIDNNNVTTDVLEEFNKIMNEPKTKKINQSVNKE